MSIVYISKCCHCLFFRNVCLYLFHVCIVFSLPHNSHICFTHFFLFHFRVYLTLTTIRLQILCRNQNVCISLVRENFVHLLWAEKSFISSSYCVNLHELNFCFTIFVGCCQFSPSSYILTKPKFRFSCSSI